MQKAFCANVKCMIIYHFQLLFVFGGSYNVIYLDIKPTKVIPN